MIQINRLLHDRQDVVLTDDGDLLTVHLDLGAGILAGDDLVARLHGHDDLLAVHRAAGADGDDLGHLG